MNHLNRSLRVLRRATIPAALAFVVTASWAGSAWAQVVGDPAPVTPTTPPAAAAQGLWGRYWGPGLATIPATASVPAGAPNLSQIDATVDFANATFPGAFNAADMFVCRWIGFVQGPVTGTVTFYTNTDDGVELIVNNVNPQIISNWTDHGPTDNQGNFDMVAGTLYPIQLTFYEKGGGAECHLTWSYTGQARIPIPATALVPPTFPTAPTLTASSPPSAPPAQVSLSWTAPAGATGYILSRSTTAPGTSGFTVFQILATNSFVDTSVTFGTQYWYMVQATTYNGQIIGPVSNTATATPVLPPVTASPNTGLVTNENGLQANFSIVFQQAAPAGGSLVTVSTSNAGEGMPTTTFAGATPNATGFTVTVLAGQTPTIPVVVTGIDDLAVDGNVAYQVNVSSSNWVPALTIPPVQLMNNDNDTPGITVTGVSGLTTEGGGTATISVVLNTIPSASTSITASSSNPAEAIISSALPLVFTNTNWSTPQTITLTGVDDTVLDFNQPYTITVTVSGGDPNYTALPPEVRGGFNADDEQVPTLPTVWGKGGCGLTGLEVVLLLGLGAAWRRRRGA